MQLKTCSICKNNKNINEFHKRKRAADGLTSACKDCRSSTEAKYRAQNGQKISEQKKNYYRQNKESVLTQKQEYSKKNRDSIKAKQREWYSANRDSYNARRRQQYHSNPKVKAKTLASNKRYYLNNAEKIKNQSKERQKLRLNSNDINFKLQKNLRSRLCNAIKRNYKTGSAIRDLGCSISQLKTHLEAQFQPGMTWDNWNRKGWHIDHIRPLSSFNLEDPEQLKLACHYTNLQPLWAEDNLNKSNKV